MVNSNDETDNDDNKPVKGRLAAETGKVFGAVRINDLPALTFFKIAETMESRSSATWKSLSANWMISETCKGRPAIRSTFFAISIFDVRFFGLG